MFEHTLTKIVLLAAFLPVLAGQSGNTGCQALAVTLRGMTLNELKRGQTRYAVIKEMVVGFCNGALVGISAAVGMYIFATIQHNDRPGELALVTWLAMVVSCVVSGAGEVLCMEHSAAGLAIDRVGRLVELPRIACMDLGRWFTYWKQLNQTLRSKNASGTALTEEESALTGAASRFLTSLSADESTLFVDVHIRFAVCERGRTPAFANGPWDALDATAPSRLRDGWEVLLTPRGGSDLSLPNKRAWPEATPGEDLGLWQRRMEDHLLGSSWHHGSAAWTGNAPNHDASTEGLEDSTAIFLGRVSIPVSTSGGLPTRTSAPVTVNNHARLFVLPNAALVSWLRAIQGTFRL
jgi:hypothetical protein